MSHPAASIKSIYSGKVNLDTPESFDQLEYSSSQESLTSRNLKNLNNTTQGDSRRNPNGNYGSNTNSVDTFNDSTNVSVVSSDDYDHRQEFIDQSLDASMENNSLFPPSPNLSRNSTTSCLSTTATKDGIEGRKLHRHGPNTYTNQVISNMIKHSDEKRFLNQSIDEKQLNSIKHDDQYKFNPSENQPSSLKHHHNLPPTDK